MRRKTNSVRLNSSNTKVMAGGKRSIYKRMGLGWSVRF